MLSDADLVRAAQGGDATSLGLLLERYRAALYGQALGILGYGPQAEDAVHDAFVVAPERRLRGLQDDRLGFETDQHLQ
jgi:RNA polymerase sigma-70 factor (ECF subfamily)